MSKPKSVELDDLLTARQAAQLMKRTPTTVYKYVRDGFWYNGRCVKLRPVRVIGGQCLFTQECLDAFSKACAKLLGIEVGPVDIVDRERIRRENEEFLRDC